MTQPLNILCLTKHCKIIRWQACLCVCGRWRCLLRVSFDKCCFCRRKLHNRYRFQINWIGRRWSIDFYVTDGIPLLWCNFAFNFLKKIFQFVLLNCGVLWLIILLFWLPLFKHFHIIKLQSADYFLKFLTRHLQLF